MHRNKLQPPSWPLAAAAHLWVCAERHPEWHHTPAQIEAPPDSLVICEGQYGAVRPAASEDKGSWQLEATEPMAIHLQHASTAMESALTRVSFAPNSTSFAPTLSPTTLSYIPLGSASQWQKLWSQDATADVSLLTCPENQRPFDRGIFPAGPAPPSDSTEAYYDG